MFERRKIHQEEWKRKIVRKVYTAVTQKEV
jgi:hypothetical protein